MYTIWLKYQSLNKVRYFGTPDFDSIFSVRESIIPENSSPESSHNIPGCCHTRIYPNCSELLNSPDFVKSFCFTRATLSLIRDFLTLQYRMVLRILLCPGILLTSSRGTPLLSIMSAKECRASWVSNFRILPVIRGCLFAGRKFCALAVDGNPGVNGNFALGFCFLSLQP